jgi:hypothetical protein
VADRVARCMARNLPGPGLLVYCLTKETMLH